MPDPVIQVAHFRTELAKAPDTAGTHALLISAARKLGFDYVALAEHGDLARSGRPPLLITNYPQAWQRRFIDRRLDRIDPVQEACRARTAGFRWAAVVAGSSLVPRQRDILAGGRRHDLYDGYTVPLHLPGARAASCSFVVGAGKSLPDAALWAADLIARETFDVLQAKARGDAAPRTLSPRQRQCVALLAAGLTDRGIARALSLSEETVTKYLNAARRRYGLARRAQLVAVALRDGQIGYGDLATD